MNDNGSEQLHTARAAGRLREALPKVSDFLKAQIQETEEHELSPVQHTARGLLDRAVCWLETMHKLDQSTHFQAHLAGFRAMLEITVDLALLFQDNALNEKLEGWEVSAKFKHAKMMAEAPDASIRVAAAKTFVNEKAGLVTELREKYWNGKHPMRWTGADLRSDIRVVHAKLPGLELEELHRDMYAYACWQVHGSGLTGTRGATGETVLPAIAIALIASAKLGLGDAELAMRILGRWDLERQKELELARKRWVLRYGNVELID